MVHTVQVLKAETVIHLDGCHVDDIRADLCISEKAAEFPNKNINKHLMSGGDSLLDTVTNNITGIS